MHTFFLQNSFRGRLSLEETLLASMPLIMLQTAKCTPSPEGVHTYPHPPDSKVAPLPDFPLSRNDITSTQCPNQSWASALIPLVPQSSLPISQHFLSGWRSSTRESLEGSPNPSPCYIPSSQWVSKTLPFTLQQERCIFSHIITSLLKSFCTLAKGFNLIFSL